MTAQTQTYPTIRTAPSSTECDFCFMKALHDVRLGNTDGWYLCEQHKAEYAWATVVA